MNLSTRVWQLATLSRSFLEPRWPTVSCRRGNRGDDDRHLPASHSMCRFSSAFLASVLTRDGYGEWDVVGGSHENSAHVDPLEVDRALTPGGMRDRRGKWRGHYWVANRERTLLIDITADQFGWSPVLVTDAQDERYRENYTPDAMIGHVRDVSLRVGVWLAEWTAFVEKRRDHAMTRT